MPGTVAGLDLAIVFELLGLGVVLFGGCAAGSLAAESAGRARPRDLRRRHRLAGGQRDRAAAAGSWTTAGIAGIAVVALIVADLAVLEYLGLRRLTAAA
jgi:hypothetical protein